MPVAPVLEELRELVSAAHALEAVDVAAAAGQFRQAVRGRQVEAAEHPALEQAITYAVRRPLRRGVRVRAAAGAGRHGAVERGQFRGCGGCGARRGGVAEPGAWVV